MKKVMLLCLSLWMVNTLSAQDDRTEQVQSAYLNLLGLHYSYAFPVGKKWTVTPHAGVSGEFGWTGNGYWAWNDDEDKDNGHSFYTLRGNIGVDVRYYYNLSRRMAQARKTAYNSGNFFAVDFQYLTRAFASHNADVEDIIVAYPCWGIRRVYQGKYMIEVTGGALTGVSEGDWKIRGPKFDLKMGFVF